MQSNNLYLFLLFITSLWVIGEITINLRLELATYHIVNFHITRSKILL